MAFFSTPSNPAAAGHLPQPLDNIDPQPVVGGEGDVGLLHSRVADKLLLRIHFLPMQIDRRLQDRGRAILADPVAEMRQVAVRARVAPLEALLPAEVLGVGALPPKLAHARVRQPSQLLQDQKPRHPADRVRRAPVPRVQRREGLLQRLPVDGAGQKIQVVALVQRVFESHAEEILLAGLGLWLSFHSCPVFGDILAVYGHPINIFL